MKLPVVQVWLSLLAAIASAQESNPVYPSPQASGLGPSGWSEAYQKARQFIQQLSIDQKAELVTGTSGPCTGNIGPFSNITGFRGLCLSDGPVGQRQATNVSTFPAGVNVAASWDRVLASQRGLYIGAEFKAKGSHIALGPVIGPLGKNALDGRNWEGFSVDPYLTGVMAEQSVTGMQSSGVQACTKHFIGYEQETQRMPSITGESVSSNIDDATMHELYLWPFANAVRAGTASIMCSYNRINETYGCQNSKAINGLLKAELGFQGHVMSDWLGQHSGVASANAGMDLAMPGGELYVFPEPSYWRGNLAQAVRNGSVSQSRLDDQAIRLMTPYFWLNQDASDYPYVDPSTAQMSIFSPNPSVTNSLVGGQSNRNVQADHAAFIRKLGAASTVLLKNTNQILPLNKPKSIGVFGNAAGKKIGDIQQTVDYYYGALPIGGGSGTGHLPYVVVPLDAIQARAQKEGTKVTSFLDNDALASGLVGPGTFLGLNVSQTPDVCIVFLKQFAAEGSDLTTLSTEYNGDDVVTKVAAKCPNTVVITNSPGPNIMPWAKNPNVKAILVQHYPGQELGNSIVDVLYGNVAPSGKLPYTIALSQDDYPSKPVTNPPYQDDFAEKLLIDYRYFDAVGRAVQYPFGHGLTYTNFSMSNTKLVSSSSGLSARPAATSTQPGGNPNLWNNVLTISCDVTNIGKSAGEAVPQLYIGLGTNVPAGHPPRQLRGFDKVSLQAGETKTVTFSVLRRDVSYWDVVLQDWVIPTGQLTAWSGFSSRDLQGQLSFALR